MSDQVYGDDFDDDDDFGSRRSSSSLSGKKIILIVLLLVALVGIAAAAYFLVFKDMLAEKSGPQKEAEAIRTGRASSAPVVSSTTQEGEPVVMVAPEFYELPQMLINLQPDAGRVSRARFMKLSIVLVLPNKEHRDLVKNRAPMIVDAIQVYTRSLPAEALQGSGGLERLRRDLLTRIETVAAPVKVENVLFKEVLVQ